MKHVKHIAAQGDVTFVIRKGDLPEGATPVPQELPGVHTVAHSETGHHHVASARQGQLYSNPANPFLFHFKPDASFFALPPLERTAALRPLLAQEVAPVEQEALEKTSVVVAHAKAGAHQHEALALDIGEGDIIDIWHQYNPVKRTRVAD